MSKEKIMCVLFNHCCTAWMPNIQLRFVLGGGGRYTGFPWGTAILITYMYLHNTCTFNSMFCSPLYNIIISLYDIDVYCCCFSLSRVCQHSVVTTWMTKITRMTMTMMRWRRAPAQPSLEGERLEVSSPGPTHSGHTLGQADRAQGGGQAPGC